MSKIQYVLIFAATVTFVFNAVLWAILFMSDLASYFPAQSVGSLVLLEAVFICAPLALIGMKQYKKGTPLAALIRKYTIFVAGLACLGLVLGYLG